MTAPASDAQGWRPMAERGIWDAVIASIRNSPDDWEIGDYYMTHVPSGCCLYISMGREYLRLQESRHTDSPRIKPGFFTGRRLWRAVEEFRFSKIGGRFFSAPQVTP